MAIARPARLKAALVADEYQLAFEVRTPIGQRYIQAIEQACFGADLATPKPGDFFFWILNEDARIITMKATAEI